MHTEQLKSPVFPVNSLSAIGVGDEFRIKCFLYIVCTLTLTFYARKINNNIKRTCTVFIKKSLIYETCFGGLFCTFNCKCCLNFDT